MSAAPVWDYLTCTLVVTGDNIVTALTGIISRALSTAVS